MQTSLPLSGIPETFGFLPSIFIIGEDILSENELEILYSSKQFQWNDISVNMVPKGYWDNSYKEVLGYLQ
jgi:hypothetical protein